MKISVNWLKTLLPIPATAQEIEEKLSVSGLEVEHIETVYPGGINLDGFVVGEVLTCTKHPNADKLSLTTVNIGDNQPKSIVCGAPNVAAGQKVIVATVGTTIHMPGKEPFTIQKAKIRGEVSEGMICAEDECGLGNSHDGILVLPPTAIAGTHANQYFNIESATTLEIGLTANRGDACSHKGVASDLAALFNHPFQRVNTNPLPTLPPTKKSIHIADTKLCERYLAIEFSNTHVAPSPENIQTHLKSIDLDPKNNLVDSSNFTLHHTGHPNHIFDADTIQGNIQVRAAIPGEKLELLDGKTIELHPEDIVIADDNGPIALAGVMGGKKTAVSAITKNILVEIAHFHPTHIRKSSKRHLIFTDASFRFERNIDKDNLPDAAHTLLELIQNHAGATPTGITDNYPVKHQPRTIHIQYPEFLKFAGDDIPADTTLQILNQLGFQCQLNQETLSCQVPSWKTDITQPVDVYEEILRIYGYDRIPMSGKIQASLGTFEGINRYNKINKIRAFLIDQGLIEASTNSLHPSAWYPNEEKAVKLSNPLSVDMDTLRVSLIPGLLQSIAFNANRRATSVQAFEIGKIYSLIPNTTDKFKELTLLSMVFWGQEQPESWESPTKNIQYYRIKQIVQGLFTRLGSTLAIDKVNIQPAKADWTKAAEINGQVWTVEIPIDNILSAKPTQKVQLPSKFPTVRRDLALVVEQSLNYKDLKATASKLNLPHLSEIKVFDVFAGKPLESHQKSVAMAFVFSNPTATLVDQEIDQSMQKLIAAFEQQGALIRK